MRDQATSTSSDLLGNFPGSRANDVASLVGDRRLRSTNSLLHLTWRRYCRHKLGLCSTFVLIFLTGIAFIVPIFVGENAANNVVVTQIMEPPSLAHPFGTDDVGRDLLYRSIYGGRISLQIGFLAAFLSMSVGVAVGGIAGYNPGWIDSSLMRFTDALLSIPTLFILIVVTQIAGQSVGVITAVIGLLSWMTVSRIVRADVLAIKERDFVLAARAIGAKPSSILGRHILPNAIAPVVVAATLGVGQAILLEASLSFLGLGVQPPTATWGSMLFRAQSQMIQAPWMAFVPGFLILLTVLCVNFMGDAVRDALDPQAIL